MMKPEYAACIAAIKLRGEPEDTRDNYAKGILGSDDRYTHIKICDPKTQTLVLHHSVATTYLRGVHRHTFVVLNGRNYAAGTFGDGAALPTAGRSSFSSYDVERADPDNPDETYWMIRQN